MIAKIKKFLKGNLPPVAAAKLKMVRSKFRAARQSLFQPKITKSRLIRDLINFGIKEGDLIFVHTSLKSIGFVEGGAGTVVDALLETVGKEGTLAMPCFSISGSMYDALEGDLVFDAKQSPATVGAIPETFRRKEGVRRSLHPTHSICAYGRKARLITAGHDTASTIFGPGTPLYKIMEEDGWIVGIGVDFGPVTFVHVIEDAAENFPLKVYGDKKYFAKIIDFDGKTKEIEVRAHDPEIAKTRIDKAEGAWIRNFFRDRLTRKKMLKSGKVGHAECWMIKASDLFDEQKKLLDMGVTVYTTFQDYQKIDKSKLND